MSYDFDSSGSIALNSDARGIHWLVEADFTLGVGRYTTAPIDVPSPNGHTYIGLSHFMQIEEIEESANPDTSQFVVRLAIVNKAMLAYLTGDQSIYRGRSIRFLAQMFDKNFKPQGQPVERWHGYMNPIRIERDKADQESGVAESYIELPCVRRGMQRARNNQGLRMTHAQQQLKHPGDMFFEHMNELATSPPPWLTVTFLKQ